MQYKDRDIPAAPLVQEITPWEVKGGADGKIDYEKLSRDVSQFLNPYIHSHASLAHKYQSILRHDSRQAENLLCSLAALC